MDGLARRLGCDYCWRPCLKRWVEDTFAAAPGRATGIALRKTEYSVPFGRHSWKGWAPPAVAAAGVRRGFIPRLTIIFPRPGFLAIPSPDLSLSWVQSLRHAVKAGRERHQVLEESRQVFGPGYTSFLLLSFVVCVTLTFLPLFSGTHRPLGTPQYHLWFLNNTVAIKGTTPY